MWAAPFRPLRAFVNNTIRKLLPARISSPVCQGWKIKVDSAFRSMLPERANRHDLFGRPSISAAWGGEVDEICGFNRVRVRCADRDLGKRRRGPSENGEVRRSRPLGAAKWTKFAGLTAFWHGVRIATWGNAGEGLRKTVKSVDLVRLGQRSGRNLRL